LDIHVSENKNKNKNIYIKKKKNKQVAKHEETFYPLLENVKSTED